MELNKTRQLLIDEYIKCLKEDKIPWREGWECNYFNPISKTQYKGINRALLSFMAITRNIRDPRWTTFSVIADKEGNYHPENKWELRKGAKGVPVEVYKIFDKDTKKNIDFNEMNRLIKNEDAVRSRFRMWSQCYYVFSYEDIDGVEPYAFNENIEREDLEYFCEQAQNSLSIKLQHDSDQAYYEIISDCVHLPPKEKFKSSEEYYETRLHEVCHATGRENRLNRDCLRLYHQSIKERAKEELRVDICSSFLLANLGVEVSEDLIENQKAYVQSWIEVLNDKPQQLFEAIRDAETIADYLFEAFNEQELLMQQMQTATLRKQLTL